MKSDRFLLFLLIGIGVLVLLAVGLYLARSGAQQAYGDETTPEGVLRNYILAVQKEDFTRAYTYLSDSTKGKPSLAAFQENLIAMQSEMYRTGVEIGTTLFNDDDTAVISVTIIHNADGVFSTPYRNVQSVTALREKGNWKIANIPYPFGDYGWFGGYYYDKVEPAPVPEN
ncbi:hypothetical protein FDZ74_09250 [bacterium]|nr:MAG: hypothetical protein FDZ74_09250 [bacterium]